MIYKKIIKYVFLPICLLILISCTEDKNENHQVREIIGIKNMFDEFNKEINVETEIFIEDSVHLLRPFRFKIVKDFMLIYDKDKSTIYSVYDMQKRTFICRFLNRGKGPNEYLRLYLSNFNEDTIMVLDIIRQRISLFNLNNLNNNIILKRTIQFKHNYKGDAVNQVFLYNNTILTTGQFKQGRYNIYSLNGDFQKYFGDYPKINTKVKFDNYHLGYIYGAEGEICSNAQSTKIACLNSNSLTIYNCKNSNNEFYETYNLQWNIPKVKEATYKNGKPYVSRIANGEIIGAGDIAITENYLFFPFSKYGRVEGLKKGIENYYGYIFVTDWNGNSIARLKLDKRINFPLEIDKEGKYLYSIHTDLETGFSQIVRFDISFL